MEEEPIVVESSEFIVIKPVKITKSVEIMDFIKLVEFVEFVKFVEPVKLIKSVVHEINPPVDPKAKITVIEASVEIVVKPSLKPEPEIPVSITAMSSSGISHNGWSHHQSESHRSRRY